MNNEIDATHSNKKLHKPIPFAEMLKRSDLEKENNNEYMIQKSQNTESLTFLNKTFTDLIE